MADIQKTVLDKGKKWISDKDNQEKLKSWSGKAWNWIKGKFGKK